jgi:hypothetical protein
VSQFYPDEECFSPIEKFGNDVFIARYMLALLHAVLYQRCLRRARGQESASAKFHVDVI